MVALGGWKSRGESWMDVGGKEGCRRAAGRRKEGCERDRVKDCTRERQAGVGWWDCVSTVGGRVGCVRACKLA